jgi:hypothetical protein
MSKKIIRCDFNECNKKLSFTETLNKCRCDKIYCSAHKHFINHNCIFDYQLQTQNKLKDSLVTAVPVKLEKC